MLKTKACTQLCSRVYVLKPLNCNYPIIFKFGRDVRRFHLQKEYIVRSYLQTTFYVLAYDLKKVATIFGKLDVTKTGRYYVCTSRLSHAIQQCL